MTIASVSRRFHVICPDLPGSGHSSKLSRPWSFEEYADWSLSFMDALTLRRPMVVGHSNGGGVALALAARQPGRIAQLVLADTVGGRRSHSMARVCLDRALDAMLEMKLNTRGVWDIGYNLRCHPRTFLHQIPVAIKADLRDLAPRVKVPTLIAWGRCDHTMPPVSAARLRALIPNASIYFSDGSHDWPMTRATEFADAVSTFVDTCPNGG